MARTKRRPVPQPHEGTLGIIVAPLTARQLAGQLARCVRDERVSNIMLIVSDDAKVDRKFKRLGPGWIGVSKLPNLDWLYEGPVYIIGVGGEDDDQADSG